MFRWLWRPALGSPITQALITQEQARSIIEVEIARRGWSRFDLRIYSLLQSKDGIGWHCQGFISETPDSVMNIKIDGQTGGIVHASAGG